MSPLLPLLCAAHAATLEVGPSSTYTSIQAAFDAANSGDTIQVAPGTYSGNLALTGKTVTIESTDGPWVTRIVASAAVTIDNSTFEGFSLDPSPSTGITLSGSGILRELYIVDPTSYGVSVTSTASGATIEEVAVLASGMHGFIAAGSATFRRSVSFNAGQVGFAFQSVSLITAQNNIAIGGTIGFRSQTSVTVNTNNVAISGSDAGLVTGAAATFTNGVFLNHTPTLSCTGGEPTISNGVAWPDASYTSCSASAANNLDVADPAFKNWSETATLFELDLEPASGSPLINAGSGSSDPDGSAADLGAFGGQYGNWSDKDSDGFPVLFDCNDHDAYSYQGATEIADSLDNNCDGVIDEGLVLDTGGDTGTTDTGTTDTNTTDTSTAEISVDVDGDGYPSDVDCSDDDIATHPGAVEILDNADNDCDGAVDEGTATNCGGEMEASCKGDTGEPGGPGPTYCGCGPGADPVGLLGLLPLVFCGWRGGRRSNRGKAAQTRRASRP